MDDFGDSIVDGDSQGEDDEQQVRQVVRQHKSDIKAFLSDNNLTEFIPVLAESQLFSKYHAI